MADFDLPMEYDAGIRISTPFDADSGRLVPEYEEREAARFCLVPWPNWIKQPYAQKVRMVAHRRIHNAIESHGRDAMKKL